MTDAPLPTPAPPPPIDLQPVARRGNHRHELIFYECPECNASFHHDIARNGAKGCKVHLITTCKHIHFRWTTAAISDKPPEVPK